MSLSAARDSAAPGFFRAHLAIARVDHWSKNVFVLPGIVIAVSVTRPPLDLTLLYHIVLGLLSTGLIASSNYVINELLDAPFDRLHPFKRGRPAARDLLSIPLAYAQWIVLMVAGLAIAGMLGTYFFWTMSVFWIMGCLYNIPPIRTKDVPFLDAASEAINNPIRLLAGWFMVAENGVPPLSLLMAYWLIGGYFMALKRFSEYREIKDADAAISYRKVFRHYTERSLLVSVMFYASAAMLFFGAFSIRYRIELVLAFPFIALVMAIYCHLAFDENSCVQHPEHLHKQKALMAALAFCVLVCSVLLFYDIPALDSIFSPSAFLPRR